MPPPPLSPEQDTDYTFPDAFTALDSKKRAYIVPIGFTPDSPDVIAYRRTLASGKPTAPYEMCQNQADYNYYPAGSPDIIFTLKNGKQISLYDFLNTEPSQRVQLAEQILQITHTNKLDPNQPLLPGHVTELAHGGGLGTRGQHARGSRASATAMIAEQDATSIEYYSIDKEGKPWHGQAVLLEDKVNNPGGNSPVLTLGYQYLEPDNTPITETQLVINHPSPRLISSYFQLPYTFLPTHPSYEHSAFTQPETTNTYPNLLTVWADWGDTSIHLSKPHHHTFTSEETQKKLHIKEDVIYQDPPRVEILHPDLVDDPKYKKDHITQEVFVDGLRLSTTSEKYAFHWHFVNCGNGDYDGWRAKRSEQSEYISGNPNQLISHALARCDNPQVFETILNLSSIDFEETVISGSLCQEAKLGSKSLVESAKENPAVLTALAQAWDNFRAKHNINENTLISTSRSSYEKAKSREITNIAYINCPLIIDTLDQLGIIKTIENNITLPSNPEYTGDIKRIPRKDFYPQSFNSNPDNLIREAISLEGQITFDQSGGITFTYASDIIRIWDPPYVHNIPFNLNFFIQDLLAAYPDDLKISFTIDDGSKCTVLTMDTSSSSYDRKFVTLNYKTTTEVFTGPTQCVCTIQPRNPHNLPEKYSEYLNTIQTEVDLSSTDGQLDQEKFAAKKGYAEKTVETTLEKMQRELWETERKLADAKRQLGQISEDRTSLSPTRTSPKPEAISDFEPTREREYTTLYSSNIDYMPSNGSANRQYSQGELYDPGTPKEPKEVTQASVGNYIEEQLDLLVKPDLAIINPELLPLHLRSKLICGLNGITGSLKPYETIEIERTRKANHLGLSVKRKLVSGQHAIPIFDHCRLAGIYHPNRAIMDSIQVSQESEWGFYKLEYDQDIPEGLEFYYEYDPDYVLTRPPTTAETNQLADRSQLTPEWQNLLNLIDNFDPPLNDKQKHDIILSAWLHSFTYSKDERIDSLYTNLDIKTRSSTIINKSIGNCGYCARGYTALCRLVGIPTIEVASYYGEKGRYFPGPQNHALCKIFIEDRWITTEPQAGYQDRELVREAIPEEFNHLIQQIPIGRNEFPLLPNTTSKTITDIVKDLKDAGVILTPEQAALLRQIVQISLKDEELYPPENPKNEPPIPTGDIQAIDILDAAMNSAYLSPNIQEELRQEAQSLNGESPSHQNELAKQIISDHLTTDQIETITQTMQLIRRQEDGTQLTEPTPIEPKLPPEFESAMARLDELESPDAISHIAQLHRAEQESLAIAEGHQAMLSIKLQTLQTEIQQYQREAGLMRQQMTEIQADQERKYKLRKRLTTTVGITTVTAITAIIIPELIPHLSAISLPNLASVDLSVITQSIPEIIKGITSTNPNEAIRTVVNAIKSLFGSNSEIAKALIHAAIGAGANQLINNILRYKREKAKLETQSQSFI